MEQRIPLKPLYVVSVFISIAAGCLALGIVIIAQFNFLKVLPHLFLLTDAVFALIIASVVFMISLVNIWLVIYVGNRYENKGKAIKIRFLLGSLFSSIPLFIGGLLIKLFGILMIQKIGLQTDSNAVLQQQTSPLIIVFCF